MLGTLNLDNIKNTTTGIALSYYYTAFRYSGENIKLLKVQDFILGHFKTAFTEYIFGHFNSGKNFCSEL